MVPGLVFVIMWQSGPSFSPSLWSCPMLRLIVEPDIRALKLVTHFNIVLEDSLCFKLDYHWHLEIRKKGYSHKETECQLGDFTFTIISTHLIHSFLFRSHLSCSVLSLHALSRDGSLCLISLAFLI
jgi:hypothetical protein